MSNKMSIDEMVRQGIAHGEEPHNLGAWANMERMLDGKNPYQKEEDRKRRPWAIILLGLIACSTAVVGGYSYLSNNATESKIAAQSPSNAQTATPLTDADDKLANQNEILAINESTTKTNGKLIKNNAKGTSSNVGAPVAYASNAPQASTLADIQEEEIKAEKAKFANHAIQQTNTTAVSRKTAKTTKVPNTNLNTTDVKAKMDQKLTASSSPNIAKKANKEKLNSGINEQVAKNSEQNKNPNVEQNENIPPTIKENYFDTTKVTEITQSLKRDATGQQKIVTDSFQYSVVEQKQRTVINPRYVELSQEQEEAAQRRTALASNNAKEAVNLPKETLPTPQLNQANAASKNTGVSMQANAAQQKTERNSFFSLFKKAGNAIKQKGIQIAHTRTPIYTSMFLGVNAAMAKHNFGGFQGGFAAMTPLGRLLTLQTEARLINQNNSGYTVTDSKQIIKSHYIDSITLSPHGRIYNYEVDSVSYGYNIKDFYTLQLPVLLNLNLRKFNVYAGMHFNYGFRMNINTSSKSNPISIVDTVYSGNYQMRTNSEPKFARDDFSDRLGLGYTIGGGYSFTNRINLDLRMSNLFWDNTSASKQEISNVFFKIPSFQLSLGYRFRTFEPEE